MRKSIAEDVAMCLAVCMLATSDDASKKEKERASNLGPTNVQLDYGHVREEFG
jgi:hypothetical protein